MPLFKFNWVLYAYNQCRSEDNVGTVKFLDNAWLYNKFKTSLGYTVSSYDKKTWKTEVLWELGIKVH